MRYRLSRSFPDTHSQGVTQVTFAPSGALLATSDLGGKLCVWNTWTGNLLHYYTPGVSVLSLIWADESTIICGLGNGSVVFLRLGNAEVHLLGSWCHSYPVEQLCISGKRLASGAYSELFIWTVGEHGQDCVKEKEIGPPMKSDGEDIIVTGLHWTTGSGNSADILITAYLAHGIFVFDSKSWTVLRKIGENTPGVVARTSLSPDGSRIAVSNLIYGFDIYDTDNGALLLTVSHKVGKEYPVPVVFIHGGRAIIAGSSLGVINIWYIDGSLSRKMQTLTVTGGQRVQSLSAHYNVHADQFLIAAGIMDGKSTVTLWKAEDTQSAASAIHIQRRPLAPLRYMPGVLVRSMSSPIAITLYVVALTFLVCYYTYSMGLVPEGFPAHPRSRIIM